MSARLSQFQKHPKDDFQRQRSNSKIGAGIKNLGLNRDTLAKAKDAEQEHEMQHRPSQKVHDLPE